MRSVLQIGLACVLGLCVACTSEGKDEREGIRLSVFAASSLTEAFGDLKRDFEREHPNVDVQLTLAGSQVLRLQIEQGAAADVFASADADHMAALRRSELVQDSQVFAYNELVVITPADNPASVTQFADLSRAPHIVLGSPHVPVGAYARQMLQRARQELGPSFVRGVLEHTVSEESNVRLVRAKIEMGEADAALVYRTDAVASRGVRVVEIPAAWNVRAAYHIGVVRGGDAPTWGDAFAAYVHSPAGHRVLTEHGFGAP